MRWLADLAYLVAAVVYSPFLVYHMVASGKNRGGWRERFGGMAPRSPDRPRVWLHAVSLGEINATPRLVTMLRDRMPGCDIVVSTTTDTGYARAVQLYGADSVFRFPLDFSPIIARALARIRPTMIVLVELEVWHNLVRMATGLDIPVVVVNGRLTERSARRFGWLRPLVRPMFSDLAWVIAQDAVVASRFTGLGVATDRLEVIASLKWDSATIAERVEGAAALAEALAIDRSKPLWVCGSTGDGEESMILDACRSMIHDGGRSPSLAIVPRKPERFDEVARLIERAGFSCVRRSRRPDATQGALPATGETRVILGDTMGELRKFYSLADVVFVGRTLVPLGGSDPMEVAALAKPIVVGPHVHNFLAAVEVLREASALRQIAHADRLADTIRELLADPAHTAEMGRRGQDVVRRHQGGTEKAVERLATIHERSQAKFEPSTRRAPERVVRLGG